MWLTNGIYKDHKLPNNLALNYFSTCSSSLTELPKGLKVKNNLEISFTKITEIPDDCEFSSLCMMQTKITKLRDNLTLNDLHASYSALQELPKNLVVLGILTVLDTDICAIPNDCLAQEIYCNFELNDKRYEKVSEGYYKLKDKIIHISHPSGREFLHTDRVLLEVIERMGMYITCVKVLMNQLLMPLQMVTTIGYMVTR